MENSVVIVGGGAAGLNVARLLSAAGVSFTVLEARGRIGGRVHTVNGYDLGPSWFWPDEQPALARVVNDLALPTFPQSSSGDVVFERMSREPVQRYAGTNQPSRSLRFIGGATSFIQALAQNFPPHHIRLNTQVTAVSVTGDAVEVSYQDEHGGHTRQAAQVVLAIPPRLATATVTFSPALAAESEALWTNTPTWMAAQAKFFALYDDAFWLTNGLSGTAQSMVGPLAEIHDATTEDGRPALMGFVGAGSAARRQMGPDTLEAACLAQLTRLFGPAAASPTRTFTKDWAADPLTSTTDDVAFGGHPRPASTWVHGDWADRLVLAGSETSPHEAGYLAGAIEASQLAAQRVLDRMGHGPSELT